jgi:hypothetical protein
MNLIHTQIEAIRFAALFTSSIWEVVITTPTENVFTQEERERPDRPDRPYPGHERERDYPNQYDEPEQRVPDDYPFQDFNYGP